MWKDSDLISWSIVTVTYNSSEALAHFWKHPIPDDIEWMVVDNASTDNSVDVAVSLGATHVIRHTENLGFSRACNAGLRRAIGRYIAFVNPDVTVDFSTLPLLSSMLSAEEALLGPQLIYPDGKLQPSGRGFPTLWKQIINRLSPPQDENSYYKFAQSDQVKYVDWVTGAAVCGRRETLECLNGWDERFFIYYEDVDLSLRAWQAGIPVKLVGKTPWIHGWARDTTRLSIGPWTHNLISIGKFYKKYPNLLIGNKVDRNSNNSAAS